MQVDVYGRSTLRYGELFCYVEPSSDSLGQGSGAQERTRTSTSLRTLAPEASASTNSTIRAGYEEYRVIKDDLDFVYIKLWLVKRVVALLLLKQFIQ